MNRRTWTRRWSSSAVLAVLGTAVGAGSIGAQQWDTLTVDEGLPGNEARAVAVLGDGVWFGIRGQGLVRLDRSWDRGRPGDEAEARLQRWTAADGLASMEVTTVVEVGGRIVVGHAVPGAVTVGMPDNDGAMAWRAIPNVLGDDRPAPRVVFDIAPDAGSSDLWLGTTNGAVRIEAPSWPDGSGRTPAVSSGPAEHVTTDDGLLISVVHAVHPETGGVWFGCREGLARRTTEGVEVLFPDDNIRSILEGPDGALWFGTSAGGTLELREGEWARHLEGRNVQPVAVGPDGTVWARSDGEGAWRYAAGSWSRLGPEQGLPSRVVYDIATAPDGSVWFATDRGLARLRP